MHAHGINRVCAFENQISVRKTCMDNMASIKYGKNITYRSLPSFDPSKQKSAASPNVCRLKINSSRRLNLRNIDAKRLV